MVIDFTQFYQMFFEEAGEHLSEMERLLLELTIEQPDSEGLNAVFRAVHSIKGSAATFGFSEIADIAHVLESVLDKVRRQELALRQDMVGVFLEAGDVLKTLLAARQNGSEPASLDRIQSITDKLARFEHASPTGTYIEENTQIQTQAGGTTEADRETDSDVYDSIIPADSGINVEKLELLEQEVVYDIQFVPRASVAAAHGVRHFLEDIEPLGHVLILVRPIDGDDQVGWWHLRFTTKVNATSFTDGLTRISAKDAWQIQTMTLEEAETNTPLALEILDAIDLAQQAAISPAVAAINELPIPPAEPPTVLTPAVDLVSPVPTFPTPIQAAVPSTPENNEKPSLVSPSPPPLPTPIPTPTLAPTAPAPTTDLRKAGATETIRVNIEKVDQLINLVGELVITQSMLLQATKNLKVETQVQIANGLALLERNTRDLQESVMAIRMVPVSSLFSRFPRMVRDMSISLNKEVELKIYGENTELDKGVIEKIVDPLTHLIRNSLDHGIETPAERLLAGKPRTGTIELRAFHQGGHIIIQVEDDGAGINRHNLLSKAKEKNILLPSSPTDHEVLTLIFEPGLSTAKEVSAVSGRGVGMDIVQKNIQKLGGRIDIDSIEGERTTITVRLPLTLAILDGMSIAVADQTYILPVSFVIESLQVDEAAIRYLPSLGRVVHIRDDYLPLLFLHELFNLPSHLNSASDGIVIILDAAGTRIALLVDALLGQHQVVIKNLEENYRRVPGVSGATIMGDGRVALILDAVALADMGREIKRT